MVGHTKKYRKYWGVDWELRVCSCRRRFLEIRFFLFSCYSNCFKAHWSIRRWRNHAMTYLIWVFKGGNHKHSICLVQSISRKPMDWKNMFCRIATHMMLERVSGTKLKSLDLCNWRKYNITWILLVGFHSLLHFLIINVPADFLFNSAYYVPACCSMHAVNPTK